jgi:excisionase family DNA binding protein
MPTDENPIEQKKRRAPRKKREMERVCVSVDEFCRSTGTSKPTAYRMMASGKLKYVQLSTRTRKIPTSEYARLGLVAD